MSKEAMKLTQMLDALIQKYSDKLYDGTGAKAANDFELDVAAIRLTLAKQPAQAEVCCGDYAKCMKPCTPRGKWLADQPAQHNVDEFDVGWNAARRFYTSSQPAQQEPIGYAVPTFDFDNSVIKKVHYAGTVPLYTTPQAQRKPLDLTAAIEYADARWAGVDVPVEWCRHFADALQPAPNPTLTNSESRAVAAINQIQRKGVWISREEAIAAIKGVK